MAYKVITIKRVIGWYSKSNIYEWSKSRFGLAKQEKFWSKRLIASLIKENYIP